MNATSGRFIKMDNNQNLYKLIVVIIERGQSAKIIKHLGRKNQIGWTLFYGSGIVDPEFAESILGIKFNPQKEVILIVEKAETVNTVLTKITKLGKLNVPGKGIAFVLDLNACFGLKKLLNNKKGGGLNE